MNAESKLLEIQCYWDEGGKEHGLALRDQLWLLEEVTRLRQHALSAKPLGEAGPWAKQGLRKGDPAKP